MPKYNEKSARRRAVIRAFGLYARMGLDDRCLNPIRKYKRIDALCRTRKIKLDMLAAADTLRHLRLTDDKETVAYIEEIYMKNPTHALGAREIARRVRECAAKRYVDERTVYRGLEKAGKIYCQLRAVEGELWEENNLHNPINE